MKKIFGSLLAGIILISSYSYASVNSTETFQRAFDRGIISTLRWETSKTENLTREKVAPILVNFIKYVARKEYRGELCEAKDIQIADAIYQDDLRTLCDYGILRGSNNRIIPKKVLTKQAAVAMVMRIIDGEQKEKKSGPWAYYYYTRARELGYYGVPNIMKDPDNAVTIEEFINFLYSTQYPFETMSKDTSKIVNYEKNGEFKSSDDALLKLYEIFRS